MKTPDEIKKGLECCTEPCGCPQCPYNDDPKECMNNNLEADALAYIQQLEAQVPKWISVEERLPKAYSTVLVAYKDAYGETNVGAGILCNYADWVGQGFAMARDAVTHWMPLPEPPKEDDHAQTD